MTGLFAIVAKLKNKRLGRSVKMCESYIYQYLLVIEHQQVFSIINLR